MNLARLLLFCILFLSSFKIAFGQAPLFITEFSNSFGGTRDEDLMAGNSTIDNGYLLTGLTYSSDGDIDSLSVYDDADIFVVKCNSQGVKEWAKTFGGNAFDKARYVIQDLDSNILVVGTTHSSDGDIDSTHGNSELFVLKLDPEGNKIWMKQYGGTGWESGRFISQISSGNYVVGGYTTSKDYDVPLNIKKHDGWLFMIDVNGQLLWSKTIGGSGAERLRGCLEMHDGGFLTYGSSSSNDYQITGNAGGHDFWVARTDSIGNFLWSKLYGGTGEDWAYHMIKSSDGNYIVSGFTESNDGDVIGFHGEKDGWIIKIDSIGNLLSQTCLGGSLLDKIFRVKENADGSLLAFGFAKSRDFDLQGVNNTYSKEYWLSHLDANLNFNWSFCIGGTVSDMGTDLLIDPIDSSLVFMGESRSINGAVVNNHGGSDFWIVKVLESTIVSDSNPEPINFNFWYDSNSENLIIDSKCDQFVNILIYSLDGRMIYNKVGIHLNSGINTFSINFNSSMHIAHISNRYNSSAKKFIIIK